MSQPPVRHVQISASAGSGKTYQLTNRYLRLLAMGEPPNRIIALTFTRKAAGEFFAAILNKLANAADDPDEARSIGQQIEWAEASPQRFAQLLKTLVHHLSELHLGTLDGFFNQILSAHSMEFGLGGPFELLDESFAEIERQQVYQQFFRRPNRGRDKAQEAFLEAFKQATFGLEEKSLLRRLDQFIQENHSLFLEEPDRTFWGNPNRIWGAAPPRWHLDEARAAHLAHILSHVETHAGSDAQQLLWSNFIQELKTWQPGLPFTSRAKTLIQNILKVRDDLSRGEGEVAYNRKGLRFVGKSATVLLTLIEGILARAIFHKVQTTQGIHAVIAAYEIHYRRAIRSRGRLTFEDVLHFLSQPQHTLALSNADEVDIAGLQLDIQYRLDSRFDHWLLDEFQDTSQLQWGILENLIDEVVQDPTGRRSFFYVGDVKQAIYSWRGGDPRLFQHVADRYNTGGATPAIIETRTLQHSFRSCPPVIDCVNRVFGNHLAMANRFPAPAVERWQSIWQDHESVHQDLSGYASHLQVDRGADRIEPVLNILQEIDPIARGLSCAILTQKNDAVAAIAQKLRAHTPFPIAEDKAVPVARDNPLGITLMALLSWGAHPADRFSEGVLRLSPLTIQNPAAMRARLLRDISNSGFAPALAGWIQSLRSQSTWDAFTDLRARDILDAAEYMDQTGERNPDRFVRFLQNYAKRSNEVGGAIRVMTIHQSKGLGFDVVICPELEGMTLTQARRGMGVDRDDAGTISWILDQPNKEVVASDPRLSAFRSGQEVEACFEKFCLLYVALTRAKRGLYLVTNAPGSTSRSANYVAWLDDTLNEGPHALSNHGGSLLYQSGDPDWFQSIPKLEVEPPLRPPTGGDLPRPPSSRLQRTRPSLAEDSAAPATTPFAPGNRRALTWGTLVHSGFEHLYRHADMDTIRQRLEAWSSTLENEVRSLGEEAKASILDGLQNPDIARWFIGPASSTEIIWNERAFDRVEDGVWISGVFDRVHLILGEDGVPLEATILDFKTNRITNDSPVEDLSKHYSSQLAAYRRALTQISGLPESQIRTGLIFTAVHQLVWI